MGIGCGFAFLVLGVFCVLAGNFMLSGSLIQPPSEIAQQNAQTWQSIAFVCFVLGVIIMIISALHGQYRKKHPLPPKNTNFHGINTEFESIYEPKKAADNWTYQQQDNNKPDWQHPNSDPRGAYGFGAYGERIYKDGWVDWLNPERKK